MSHNNLNLPRKCQAIRLKDTRVRAFNEPRIIGPFYDEHPRLSPVDLSVSINAIAKGAADIRRTLRSAIYIHIYTRIFCGICRTLCRFGSPGDNRRTMRYQSRVLWNARTRDLGSIGESKGKLLTRLL